MAKKKSGKAKSGKGKKGKKADDEQMSIREAILAYQINIKEKQLEDLNYESESLQKKIEKGKERNTKLREEQLGHLTSVVKDVRTEEENDKRDPITGRANIEESLRDLWMTDVNERKEIAALLKQIELLEEEIREEMVILNKWNDYKDYGQYEDEHRVAVLEDELRDNQATFDEQSNFHQQDLAKNKREVGAVTDKTVESVKDGAAEKAMAKMDKKERREITDHSWLKQEHIRYSEEVQRLEEEARDLEQHNLNLMSKLFDCRMEDLNISRKFFLTQFDGDSVFANEVDSFRGIIEHDLVTNHPLLRPSPFAPQLQNPADESQLLAASETSFASLDRHANNGVVVGTAKADSVLNDDNTSGYSTMPAQSLTGTMSSVQRDRHLATRPKSATLKAIEEKVFGSGEEQDVDEGIDLDETGVVDADLGLQAGEGLANNLLDNYFSLEDESHDEYLKLGPLELKMLQVVGTQIPIRSPTPPTQEELELQAYNPDNWPVSHKMLQNIQAESFQSLKNASSVEASTVGKNTSMLEDNLAQLNTASSGMNQAYPGTLGTASGRSVLTTAVVTDSAVSK